MFVTVFLSKMHNWYHKENMLNSAFIHKRRSSYFPAKTHNKGHCNSKWLALADRFDCTL